MNADQGRRTRKQEDMHLRRIYARIDDLDRRMLRIERVVWSIGTAAVMTAGTALYNLAHTLGGG
ncbi:MAG TPA: hypothetical protein VGP91_18060 [Actinoplanes sp.]|nr:hypothetical protein [Actinoplanes sp.]